MASASRATYERQRRAKRREMLRVYLRSQLGASCKQCGADHDVCLEFDCISPCGDEHHRMNSHDRLEFYLHEFIKGNLQVLCSPCNNKKSHSEGSQHYLNQKRKRSRNKFNRL